MKNILYLETGTPTLEGGAGGSVYSLLEIIKGIKNSNYKISVLFYNKFNISEKFEELNCRVIIKNKSTYNNFSTSTKKEIRRRRKNNSIIKWIKFNLAWIKLYKDVKYISGVLKENNIDILHCNDRLSTNFAGILAAKLTGIKIIVHQRQYEEKLPIFMKFIGRKVDKYFAVSNSIANNLAEALSNKQQNIEVLFNWISTLNQSIDRNKEIGKNILWLGRIVPWKGTHLLLDIIEKLVENGIKFNKVFIYGEADASTEEYFLSIKEKILKRNLSQYFEIKGYTEFEDINLGEYFAFIHTSIKPEPFGRTIIEAMINGILTFATNLGGVTDIIDDDINGYLYDINNLNELVDKFSKIQDQNYYFTIQENAKNSVLEKFSGKNQIPRLLEIYESIQ